MVSKFSAYLRLRSVVDQIPQKAFICLSQARRREERSAAK